MSAIRCVVYIAECMKHKLIYTEQTGDQLNNRLNRHRADIRFYPDRCGLSKHFDNNDCNFKRKLKISVLERIKGSKAKR